MIYFSEGKQEFVPSYSAYSNVCNCQEQGPCFARNIAGKCSILNPPLPVNYCSFCKPKRTVTNGVEYPYYEGLLDHRKRGLNK